jgi:hypothetical protein
MKRSTLCAIAFASTSFSAAALQALFVTYHVTLFVNVYKLSARWFTFGELFIMVWTTLNDPLFGYIMSSSHGYRRHLNAISMGGALLSLAFLIPFFPLWPLNNDVEIGLHFILSLFLYDGLFSYVMSNVFCIISNTRNVFLMTNLNFYSCSFIIISRYHKCCF